MAVFLIPQILTDLKTVHHRHIKIKGEKIGFSSIHSIMDMASMQFSAVSTYSQPPPAPGR